MKWLVTTVLMDAMSQCMKGGLNSSLDTSFCCRLALSLTGLWVDEFTIQGTTIIQNYHLFAVHCCAICD